MTLPGGPPAEVELTFAVTLPPNTPSDEQIYLAYNFKKWVPGDPASRLTRSGNTAFIRLKVPAGYSLLYKYTRGSWATVEVAANGFSVANRWLEVQAPQTVIDNVANWRDRVTSQPRIDPRVHRVTINSGVLKVPKSFYIYLPPGYFDPGNETKRYPVIYLFRGHEREWVNGDEDLSRQGKTAIDTFLGCLETGQVGPVILVFPGISSDENSVPGLLVIFKSPGLAGGSRGIGTGCFEDYFLQELLPYVDGQYRTLGQPSHRGVDGFSLGGLTALKIAAQYPALFQSAGAYDGTFFYATGDGQSIRKDDRVFLAPIFNPHFGLPRDYDYGARNNPVNLILRGEFSELSHLTWLVQSGPETAEPTNSNYYRAQHLLQALKDKGLKNSVPAVMPQGAHNWATADLHLAQTLPLHWQALKEK